MTLHLLPLKIPSVEELGLPESLYALAKRQSGLLLAAGTAGSGKTTTIASIVNSIARSVSKSVITIEQPIEYLYQPGESIICQREAGIDSISYMSALSSVLHQDADIVVLGGLRDIDTVSLAITAAKTGHLVMAPLETDSAAEAVECLADFYPIAQQQKMRQRLADVLLGVTAQQLLPKREGVGRIAAFEVMTVTPLVKSLLCDGKTKQLTTVMQAGADNGMQTMDGALYELYMKSRISAETAVRFSRDADSMLQKL